MSNPSVPKGHPLNPHLPPVSNPGVIAGKATADESPAPRTYITDADKRLAEGQAMRAKGFDAAKHSDLVDSLREASNLGELVAKAQPVLADKSVTPEAIAAKAAATAYVQSVASSLGAENPLTAGKGR